MIPLSQSLHVFSVPVCYSSHTPKICWYIAGLDSCWFTFGLFLNPKCGCTMALKPYVVLWLRIRCWPFLRSLWHFVCQVGYFSAIFNCVMLPELNFLLSLSFRWSLLRLSQDAPDKPLSALFGTLLIGYSPKTDRLWEIRKEDIPSLDRED